MQIRKVSCRAERSASPSNVQSIRLRQSAVGGRAQAGAPDDKPTRRGNVLWRSFWGAHQRFFRHLCMAAKVPGLVRMTNVRALPALCGNMYGALT